MSLNKEPKSNLFIVWRLSDKFNEFFFQLFYSQKKYKFIH